MRPPHSLSMTALGLVFLVFLPSMVTTPMAGNITRRIGPGPASAASLALALLGLVLLLVSSFLAVVAGMTLVGVGTFFAQAVATGHVGRIARGDKAAYGKQALEYYGVWKDVEKKIAFAENVRAALKLVTTGEAPLGIVYETDARAEKGVKVVDTFGEESHKPIVYPVAPIAASKNPATKEFFEFLRGPEATEIFKQAGFTVMAGS